MNYTKDEIDKIKRMIRNLKKEEMRIIQGIYGVHVDTIPLVWNQFFDLKKPYKQQVKYNLDQLINMNNNDLKQVIADYFSSIFYRFYKAGTNTKEKIGNKALLEVMGLPLDATIDDIKKRFRELAKITHPDAGGSSIDFITINEAYHELKKNMKKE